MALKNNDMKTPIKFTKNPDFYQDLRNLIFRYFRRYEIAKYANFSWYLKASFLLGTYFLAYTALLLLGQSLIIMLGTFALMGILSVLIGLNIGHDAAHQSISPRKWVNAIFLRVFDIVGANSYMWKIRHVHAHHPYPNIVHQDSDINQSPLVRIFPESKVKSIHKYQHVYTPMLMILFYTLNWLLFRDFKDFKTTRFGAKKVSSHGKKQLIILIICKLLFIIKCIVVPALFVQSWGWVLLGFYIMNVSSGMVITVALVSAHVGDHQAFPEPNKEGKIATTWAEHQVATTSDFCTKSRFMTQVFGGFNHHVIHHLFPNINHIHYSKITPALERFARNGRLKYTAKQNLRSVFNAHIQLLKREGIHYWRSHGEI